MTESHTNFVVQIKRTSSFFWRFFFLLALIILTSCQSLSFGKRTSKISEPLSEYVPENFEWKKISPGIESFCFENPSFPLRYIIVKIDLSTPGLKLYSSPKSEEVKSRYSPIHRKSIEDFAMENSCVVAWNTCPFDLTKSIASNIEGAYKTDGKLLSPPMEEYAALMIRKTESGYEASICDAQNEALFLDKDYVIGGFYQTLSGGLPSDSFRKSNDSRTAVGLSDGGLIMYVLSVEGENADLSTGLSYEQCNDIFMALGCESAMHFDGGGSTNLYLDGKRALSYPEKRKSPAYMGFGR